MTPGNIASRISNIKQIVYENINGHKRTPLCISDILLVQLLTGGAVKIDNRSVDSPIIYQKLLMLEENLSTMSNVIFSTATGTNGTNLLLGDLVDVALYSGTSDVVHTTLLRNIDFLIVPDSEIYRSMQNTKLAKGSVCQKLLALNTSDIVDIVFKIKSFKSRMNSNPTPIRCTDDLVDVTNEGDFILLLHNDLAFMVATIENDDGESEQCFYIISGRDGTTEPVQKQDSYAILGLYISISELLEDE